MNSSSKLNGKKILIDIVSLIILLILVFLGYKFFSKDNKTSSDDTPTTSKSLVSTNDLLNPNINWSQLLSQNKEIVGWIYIPNTDINYPILCSKERDKYLRTDWKTGEETLGGSIFGDSRYYGQDIIDSTKYIIHGHNLGPLSTEMFSQLKEYLNEDFYNKHPNIYIYTPKGNIKYDVISIKIVDPMDGIYQKYDRDEHKAWINKQIKESNVKCTIHKYSLNKSILLSTCTNDEKNRIVIIGEALERSISKR